MAKRTLKEIPTYPDESLLKEPIPEIEAAKTERVTITETKMASAEKAYALSKEKK